MIRITLKAARVNSGLTQMEAAKSLGINSKTLSDWENGHTVPRMTYVGKLCSLYNIEYDYLNFYPPIRLKRRKNEEV